MFSLSGSMMTYSCDYSNRFSTAVCSAFSSGKRVAQVALVIISLGVVVYYISSKLSSRVHAIKLKSLQPEPLQPESTRELLQPESVPEPLQSESTRELLQPKSVPEPIQSESTRELLQPKSVPEPLQSESIRELLQPKSVPEPLQSESTRELLQPESVPEPLQSESTPELSPLGDSLTLPLIDQEVMDFALQNIEAVSPHNFRNRNPDMPEVKGDLARLMTKFYQYEQDFFDFLEAKPIQGVPGRFIQDSPELGDDSKNPWLDEKIIDIADNCIKIAYAISIKTIEELPDFIEEAQTKGFLFESKIKTLTYQGAYQYESYFYLPRLFHDLRGCLIVKQYPDGTTNFGRIRAEKENKNHQKFLNEHIAKFYQSGTKQSKWRELFNGYCDYVRAQVGGEEALQKDPRFVQWIQKVPDQIQWESSRHRKGLLLDKFVAPRATPT